MTLDPIAPVPAPRAPASVLIVDDTEDHRALLRDLLAHAGYALFEAHDGCAGVAMATAHRPDLIVMDIQLPILDGYEATRRIKANPALAHIPIIAVTADARWSDERLARTAGCNGFVTKPFSPRQLLSTVRELLAA